MRTVLCCCLNDAVVVCLVLFVGLNSTVNGQIQIAIIRRAGTFDRLAYN